MGENKYTIPGTNIRLGGLLGSVFTDGFLGNMLSSFLGGFGSGLLLSQITNIAEDLSKETIQNWVKRNYVDPPRKGKFYDENQVARILIFNSLRKTLQLEDIKMMLQFVNEKSNGTLFEKELLGIFNDSVFKTKGVPSGDFAGYDKAIGGEIMKSLDKKEGDKAKIKSVIFIMLTAYQSSLLKKQAEDLVFELKAEI